VQKKLKIVSGLNEDLKKQVTALKRDNKNLQSQVSRMEKQEVNLQLRLEDAQKRRAELVQKTITLQSTIRQSKKQLRASEKEKDKLAKQQSKELVQKLRSETAAAKHVEPGDLHAVEEEVLARARGIEGISEKPKASLLGKAKAHYQRGVRKWDRDDIDGAREEFKQAVHYNPEAAGAYYNIGLAFLRKGNRTEACDYAYKAGKCYLKHGNRKQTTRMIMFLKTIDSGSPYIEKLQKALSKQTP